MIATVAVRAYYQPHCRECMAGVEQTVASAVRDGSVTSVSLVAQKRCEHDALAAPRLAGTHQPKQLAPATQAKSDPPPPTPHIPAANDLVSLDLAFDLSRTLEGTGYEQ